MWRPRRNCGEGKAEGRATTSMGQSCILVLAGWTSVLGNVASLSARSAHFESELKEPFDLGRMYSLSAGCKFTREGSQTERLTG